MIIHFTIKEIATIKLERKNLNYNEDGVILMAAGGGVLLLDAVNGAYRGDKVKAWYTSGSFITAGALLDRRIFINKKPVQNISSRKKIYT